MKKKTKFMTAILSEEEWIAIQYAMKYAENEIERVLATLEVQIANKENIWRDNMIYNLQRIKREFAIVHHFNSISVPNIESMADKIEKQRRKEKKSGKKNS